MTKEEFRKQLLAMLQDKPAPTTALARAVRDATSLWLIVAEQTSRTREEEEDGVYVHVHVTTQRVVWWTLTEEQAQRIAQGMRDGFGPDNVGGWEKNVVWRVRECQYPVPLNDDQAHQLCEAMSAAWGERFVNIEKARNR